MLESALQPVDTMSIENQTTETDVLTSEPSSPRKVKKEASKDIRYRTIFEDADGDTLKSIEGPEPSNLREDSEDEEETVESVLDIITHVTVRKVTTTKRINTETAAKVAGEAPVDGPDMKSDANTKEFKITSVGKTEMEIHSPSVRRALRTTVKYYPDQRLNGKTIKIWEPYYILFHYRKELENLASCLASGDIPATDCSTDAEKDEPWPQDAADHIKLVLSFLNARIKKKIEAEERLHGLETPRATFELMWLLLKPGTPVYIETDGEIDGFIIKSIKPLHGADDVMVQYQLSVLSLDYNGKFIRRVRKVVYFNKFPGEQNITTLRVFPVHLSISGRTVHLRSDRWDKLVQRGNKYWELLKKGFVQVTYDGRLLRSSKFYKGKAIIDPEFYYQQENTTREKPGSTDDDKEDDDQCTCEECTAVRATEKKSTDLWVSFDQIYPRPDLTAQDGNSDSMHEPQTITDQYLFLLPREMPGFILKTREWEVLDVDCMDVCEANPGAISKLRIPEGRKKMVSMLSHKYTEPQRKGLAAWSADFVQNKGEGQIFLLHGPSGVGKTYTAESIAEMTGRPLLSLSVANIGTDEDAIESQLEVWFNRAERWQAIMLIDEADVYFERRASGQLQRNSLVSAFLRSMEYYRGILFLTTNRLGAIDDAILSRIHLILEYNDLSEADRAQIWDQYIEKLLTERENFIVSPYVAEYLKNDPDILSLKWNGREIRNAFQTAVALAEYEAKESDQSKKKEVIVKKEHFSQVAEMSLAFKEYMKRSFGDASKRAWLEGVRMDDSVRELNIKRKERFEQERQVKLTQRERQ